MSISSGLFVVAVAVILRDNTVASNEDRNEINKNFRHFVVECALEHDVSMETLKEAKEVNSFDDVNHCFLACLFKKTHIMDDSGKFNVEQSKKQTRAFFHDEEHIKKADEATDHCSSVNEAEVSDGDNGCERAKLLSACLAKHKQLPYLI